MAARRVRPRSAVSRHGGRRRPDLQFVGARAAPPVGADAERRRPRAHAVRERVRVDRTVGPRAAHPLHARALFGRMVDGLLGLTGRGGRIHLRVVHQTQTSCVDPQRAFARGHRLHPAQQMGHADPPRLERAVRLAEVRVRPAVRILHRGACRGRRTRHHTVPADPRHEPDLHGQGRLLHRHQAGQPGRRGRGARRRTVRRVRRTARWRGLPAGRHGQGLGAARLRRTSRRHHRLGVRPGLSRPADQLARRLGAGCHRPRQCSEPVVAGCRRFSGGVERRGAQPDRHRHRAPGRTVPGPGARL